MYFGCWLVFFLPLARIDCLSDIFYPMILFTPQGYSEFSIIQIGFIYKISLEFYGNGSCKLFEEWVLCFS